MEFIHNDSSLVPEEEIRRASSELAPYLDHMRDIAASGAYDAPESSINLPFDEGYISGAERLAAEKGGPSLKYIFLIGIGGSNLGAKALYEARYLYRDQFGGMKAEGETGPRMVFIDTVHGLLAEEAAELIAERIESPDEVMVIVASKSGATLESAINFEIIRDALTSKFSLNAAVSRMVAITDRESPLWQAAAGRKIAVLEIPRSVGGRYSVFSHVGLFPLALAGFDIRSLAGKARDMRDRCLGERGNPALDAAAAAFFHYKSEKTMHDMFVFGPELESAGKWWRQLVAESLGKSAKDGKRVGITPTVSVGSTDLHSMGQLYMGGPNERFTTFLSVQGPPGIKAPKNYLLFPAASGEEPDAVLDAIREGTASVYREQSMPFEEIRLAHMNDIAGFMQFEMIETMFLGQLLGVNAFDQPEVELYKRETREILEST